MTKARVNASFPFVSVLWSPTVPKHSILSDCQHPFWPSPKELILTVPPFGRSTPFTQFTPSRPLLHPPQAWTGCIAGRGWRMGVCPCTQSASSGPSDHSQPRFTSLWVHMSPVLTTGDFREWVGTYEKATPDIHRHGHHCPLNRVRLPTKGLGESKCSTHTPFYLHWHESNSNLFYQGDIFLEKRGSADSSILVALLLVLAGIFYRGF